MSNHRPKKRQTRLPLLWIYAPMAGEQSYLKALKSTFRSQLRDKLLIEIMPTGPHKNSQGDSDKPATVDKALIALNQTFEEIGKPLDQDQYFCILDHDGAPKQNCDDAQAKARQRLSRPLTLLWNVPCFEVWIWHHFQKDYSSKPFSTCSEVTKEVKNFFETVLKMPYEKTHPGNYEKLGTERLRKALAHTLQQPETTTPYTLESYTGMHLLFQALAFDPDSD